MKNYYFKYWRINPITLQRIEADENIIALNVVHACMLMEKVCHFSLIEYVRLETLKYSIKKTGDNSFQFSDYYPQIKNPDNVKES